MLVLTRYFGESIYLSDRETGEIIAEIKVLDIRGNYIDLGIEAPYKVLIDRRLPAKKKEKPSLMEEKILFDE
jgi:carbon storage regulator CsrA